MPIIRDSLPLQLFEQNHKYPLPSKSISYSVKFVSLQSLNLAAPFEHYEQFLLTILKALHTINPVVVRPPALSNQCGEHFAIQ